MADAGNWWDSSSRTRYESGASSSSSSAAVNPTGAFTWLPADMPDMIKSTSSMDPPGTGLVDPNLHLMGLGLPSHNHAMDWNQTLLSAGFSSDHSGGYGGLVGSTDHQNQNQNQNQNQYHQNQQQQSHDYQFNTHVHAGYNYGMNNNEFGRTASDLRPPSHNPLHFSNNAPFWNSTNEVFPSLQSPSFTDHHRPTKVNMGDQVGDEKTTIKKSGNSEAASKRPRNESPLPPFKVRKEKMGDRITALQQLVSPFGKTDTASVLSEAIEYIKFLHEQVSVLTTPYLKSGAPIQHQHQQGVEEPEGAKKDLRSRGLCLVPVSSTFPVTHETTVDFWTPTFGGTFR